MFEWIYQFRNAIDCVRFQHAKSSTRRKKLIIFNNVGVTLSVVFCFPQRYFGKYTCLVVGVPFTGVPVQRMCSRISDVQCARKWLCCLKRYGWLHTHNIQQIQFPQHTICTVSTTYNRYSFHNIQYVQFPQHTTYTVSTTYNRYSFHNIQYVVSTTYNRYSFHNIQYVQFPQHTTYTVSTTYNMYSFHNIQHIQFLNETDVSLYNVSM